MTQRMVIWGTVVLLGIIAAFQKKAGWMNILIVIGCVLAAVGNVYFMVK